jgi:hypothetical protein
MGKKKELFFLLFFKKKKNNLIIYKLFIKKNFFNTFKLKNLKFPFLIFKLLNFM